MKPNVGTADRVLRAVAGGAMLVSAVVVPFPLIAIPGGYMVLTSLAGTCLGYRLLGRSTCPVQRP